MSKEDMLKKDFIKASIVFNAMLIPFIFLHLLLPDLMNEFISLSIVIFCLASFFNLIMIVFVLQLRKKKSCSIIEQGMRSTQKPL